MSWQSYKATIASIRSLAPNVSELVLTLVDPPTLSFKAGQAVAISVPVSPSAPPLRRYYSLASPPSASHQVRLLLDQGEQGIVSEFLRNQPVGGELLLEGPFGSFCLEDHAQPAWLFVATGTGIAPFRAMIATLLEMGISQPITLLWGLRRECDVYYREELESWAVRYPQFSFILTLSQADHHWTGSKGRVTHILEGMDQVERCAVFVCGGRKMVAEVTALLHKRGVTHVYRERHHDVP